MKTLEEVKSLMLANLKEFGHFCLPRDYANMCIRFMGFVGQYSAHKIWLNDTIGDTNVIVKGETCIYASEESFEVTNIVKVLSWNKSAIFEDTYNFLCNKEAKETEKDDVFARNLCVVVAGEAATMDLDTFTHYYVETFILCAGNRGVSKDITQYLGLKDNAQIDVIYYALLNLKTIQK
jgi:hypothetical protein